MSQAATDTFALTTSPAAYLPRPDSDRALRELEDWALDGDASSVWFTGPAGLGKTLLLKVLADRLSGRRRCVYVSYPVLPPNEFAAWVLDILRESAGDAPQHRIVALAKERADQGGMLLLIDDALSLPQATRRALDDWYAESGGALRFVLAATSDSSAIATGEAVGDAQRTLCKLLSLDESRAMLMAAMERGQLGGEARAFFDAATVRELHERSGGVPARLLIEADRVLFAGSEAVAADAASVEPVAAVAEPPARATPVHAAFEVGPAPGGRLDPALPPAAHSRRRRRSVVAAWGAGAFACGIVAALIAIRSLGVDPRAAVAQLTALTGSDRGASTVEVGADEFREPVATRVGARDIDERPATETAVPPPAALPAVAAAPPPAAAVPAPAASTAPTDGRRIVTDGVIRAGEWLAASFRRNGIPVSLIDLITHQVGDRFDFKLSRPGHRYSVILDGSGELVEFRYLIGPSDVLQVRRTGRDYSVVRSAPAAR